VDVLASRVGSLAAAVRSTSATIDDVQSNNTVSLTTSVIGAPRITAAIDGTPARSGALVILRLQLTNSGSGRAEQGSIQTLALRVTAGAGVTGLVSPALPLSFGPLDPGAAQTIELRLEVASSVTRMSLTESGEVKDALGNTYRFSSGQAVAMP
jgi:hypothetical protein